MAPSIGDTDPSKKRVRPVSYAHLYRQIQTIAEKGAKDHEKRAVRFLDTNGNPWGVSHKLRAGTTRMELKVYGPDNNIFSSIGALGVYLAEKGLYNRWADDDKKDNDATREAPELEMSMSCMTTLSTQSEADASKDVADSETPHTPNVADKVDAQNATSAASEDVEVVEQTVQEADEVLNADSDYSADEDVMHAKHVHALTQDIMKHTDAVRQSRVTLKKQKDKVQKLKQELISAEEECVKIEKVRAW